MSFHFLEEMSIMSSFLMIEKCIILREAGVTHIYSEI